MTNRKFIDLPPTPPADQIRFWGFLVKVEVLAITCESDASGGRTSKDFRFFLNLKIEET